MLCVSPIYLRDDTYSRL